MIMAEQQTLRIGQIIYILSNKSQSVVPAIIAGRNIAETLEGQAVSYKVKVGPPDRVQIVDLGRIDGDLYTSLEDIRALLLKNLTDFVNTLVVSTQDKANAWYGVQGQLPGAPVSPGQKLDPEQIMSAVESGVPIQHQQIQQQQAAPHPLMLGSGQQGPVHQPQGNLRDHLRNMVAPDGEPTYGNIQAGGPLDIGGPDQGEAVVLPDGTIRKLKVNLGE